MKWVSMLVLVMTLAAALAFANGEGESAPEIPTREGFSSATAAGVNV
jgi:hypothetical protein